MAETASTSAAGRPDGLVPEVSLVVPVFNEEATLEEVYGRSVEALDGLERPFEIIFVDDGSRDGTWEIVERIHASDPRAGGIRFKRNFGQHPAMHAGFSRARGEASS